eukprot:gnl/TRDRNA2_/TRDRNA2_173036_c1_seq2.p1 gnl/TRDRNA2_/TRDRNA2_173036_c1~~gnl/TRDRNA2_/TRDRNA2_173036_c1_seq2.p1  ORF type:complete len:351 (+),score=55.63 gnl/TRDRNA2_/TRDRNA2_173036_c1_seq2:40-1053(+)
MTTPPPEGKTTPPPEANGQTIKAYSSGCVTAGAAVRRAIAAHVYVSEGKDAATIARLSAAGAAAGAVVANEFLDAAYHRSGITLAAPDDARIEAAVTAVCRAALDALDFQSHVATHPRIGTVDHVCVNPLGTATRSGAGALAERIGKQLGCPSPEVGPPLRVYLYGAARQDERPLADLRRSLGYFSGAANGQWSGLSPEMDAAIRGLEPDFGPQDLDPRHGAVVVGAVPWVVNYNLLVVADGLSEAELMARCRRVARATSERGGGLPSVQTMALPHERGVEVACNLLDVDVTPPAAVRARVLELCAGEEVVLDSDYFTNKNPEEILEVAMAAVPPVM